MKNLTAAICLTLAVLLGSVGEGKTFQIPENARLNIYGNDWTCDTGYRRAGNGCLKMTVAEYQAQINALRTFGGGGASYDYDVSGYGNGENVSGSIDASSGSRDVDGYITLEDGREVSFEGEWVGKGEIEGYDEDGNYYELEVD